MIGRRGHGAGPGSISSTVTTRQPLAQADASISRTYGGIGLGLSISRRFVALHGGELTIESVPGEGTTVRVTFAAARALGHTRQAIVAVLPAEASTIS